MAGLAALLASPVAGTALAVPPNDNFANPIQLVLGQTDDRFNNFQATTEAGEALTASSADRPFCGPGDGRVSQSRFTTWWQVVGTGRPVQISTAGSSFDTIVGIFHGTINDPALLCADSAGTESFAFDTNAGQIYHVQVGTCTPGLVNPFNPSCPGGAPTTLISLTATSAAAANDDRANAAVLPTGQLLTGDNFAATEEAGEPFDCTSARGASPYGRTVWYRWTSPGNGTAVFTSTGFDTVMAVYQAGNTPLRCDDDPAVAGPSRIPLTVSAGDYFVQVGGFGRHAGFADSNQGQFNISAEFSAAPPPPPPPPPDGDGDGIPDASDSCPTVKPTVDANRDGCQDKPVRILALLTYDFNRYRRFGVIRGQALTDVRLIHVPTGSLVRATCAKCQKLDARGRTRNFRSFRLTVKHGSTQPLPRLNRLLLPFGSRLVLVVTKPGQLGRRLSTSAVAGHRKPVKAPPACLAVGSTTRRVPCSTGS